MRNLAGLTDETSIQRYFDAENAIELVVYTKFHLSGIDREFKIADFERAVKQKHMLQIADAIMARKLYDPIITVMARKKETEPYVVIDGQHRVTAMKYLYAEGRLAEYTFVVRVLHAEDERHAYRMLNNGKPLTSYDLLKSYDDGSVAFFQQLRDYCAHYKTTHKVPYSMIAYAYSYAVGGKHATFGREKVMKKALSLSSADLAPLQVFFECIKQAQDDDKLTVPGYLLFKVPVFWSLAKFYREKGGFVSPANMRAQFTKMLASAETDPSIKRLASLSKTSGTLEDIDHRLESLWWVAGKNFKVPAAV